MFFETAYSTYWEETYILKLTNAVTSFELRIEMVKVDMIDGEPIRAYYLDYGQLINNSSNLKMVTAHSNRAIYMHTHETRTFILVKWCCL